MPVTPDDLTPAERLLWDAYPTGAWADLSDQPDGPERTVRADVLAALLRGARTAQAGQPSGVFVRGATITGPLDLTYAEVAVAWTMEHCTFDSTPELRGARLRAIRLHDCELPGFVGRLIRVDGDLDLRGSTVRGQFSLVRARITGELRLAGARLVNPGGWALFAGGMVVESGVFGAYSTAPSAPTPLSVEGGLRLSGARLQSGLFLDGVSIRNPGAVAIHGENLQVFGRMVCGDGFLAEGRVELPHARIDGELTFADGRVSGLVLTNSTVDDLNLRTAEPIAGLVDLRHARCTVLRDNSDRWPAELALDGFSYEAIDSDAPGLAVRRRLDWLRRDRSLRPQPYEQLAQLYRRLGADAEARRVSLAKQRRLRREQPWPNRMLGYLLDATVGYGYRPWLAAGWLLLMLAIGTVVFLDQPPQPLVPGRAFDPTIYTLDLLVPISAFGLRDAFAPVGSTRWLAYALTGAGWLLATALVAGITRALRRD